DHLSRLVAARLADGGGIATALQLRMSERVGHEVGDVRPHPEDRRARPRGVYTVRQEDDEEIPVWVHPHRRPGETGVAERAPGQLRARARVPGVRRCIPAESASRARREVLTR